MKEKLTNNLSLKILSLIIAFLTWLVIINIEDPAIVGTFEGIPVEIINEHALESEDKVYDIITGETVDIAVKGKRSIIENLSRGNFKAIADLSDLSIVNAIEIDVSVPGYTDQVEIIRQSESTMKISLEDVVMGQFRVDIIEKGNVAEGFYINEKTASPNMVQIKAAESVISKIKEVVVVVDISNTSESFKIKSTAQVFDHNGTLMDPDKMEISHEEFYITVNMLQTKTVKLFLSLEGKAANGYGVVNFAYEPKEVEIAGRVEALAKVPNIVGTYNINNSRIDIEDEVNITEFIKDDIILIDDNQNAVVNIDIEPLENKDILFTSSAIELRNLPDNKTLEYDNIGLLKVTISGVRDEINKLSIDNLKPYIDLATFRGNKGLATVMFAYGDGSVNFSTVTVPIILTEK